jgi:hypothetical protein
MFAILIHREDAPSAVPNMRDLPPPFRFDLRAVLKNARRKLNTRVGGVSISLPFIPFNGKAEIIRNKDTVHVVLNVSNVTPPPDSLLHEMQVRFPTSVTVSDYELIGSRSISTQGRRTELLASLTGPDEFVRSLRIAGTACFECF